MFNCEGAGESAGSEKAARVCGYLDKYGAYHESREAWMVQNEPVFGRFMEVDLERSGRSVQKD